MVATSGNPDRPLTPRDTGRGIVIRDGKILLMERWRPSMHYFSIPGGGIEEGETADQTAVREIFEETTIEVTASKLAFVMIDGDIKHHMFLCDYITGEPELHKDAPEAQNPSDDNVFDPKWVSIDDLPSMTFTYWEPLKQPLIEGIKTKFAGGPVTVTING